MRTELPIHSLVGWLVTVQYGRFADDNMNFTVYVYLADVFLQSGLQNIKTALLLKKKHNVSNELIYTYTYKYTSF